VTHLRIPNPTPSPCSRAPFPMHIRKGSVAFFALILHGCVSGGLHAETAPPVGFVRLVVPSNGQALISMPFDAFDPALNAVLSGQLTGSTNSLLSDRISFWLPNAQSYTNAWLASGLGDPNLDGLWVSGFDEPVLPSALAIAPGTAFWLANRQPSEQSVFLTGRVPLESPVARLIVPGLNLVGYPFAASTALEATTLLSSGGWSPETGYGDELSRWPASGTEYLWYGLRGDGAHGPAGSMSPIPTARPKPSPTAAPAARSCTWTPPGAPTAPSGFWARRSCPSACTPSPGSSPARP
jgi:hypothetical protein